MREASGIAPGLSSLPSGSGGISPLGERFQPDLVRGGGSYAVPINCPKGPNNLQPSLTLTYSTGSGNGPFGLGWRISNMRIERRSDRGIPSYTDADTFMIGDAEILVPVGGNRYRPQSDTKFWRIEQVGEHWEIRTGDGKRLIFGQTPNSRESEGTRVFAWYLEEERDAAGNTIHYQYRRDQNKLYLETVRYSLFTVRLSYETRLDPVRNARSGFERQMGLRVAAIALHCDRLSPSPMRTYTFTYEQADNGVSLLSRIALSATEGDQTARFPDLTFTYSRPNFTEWQIHDLQALVAPPSLEDPTAQLVDLTGDGLPDILQTVGARMFLWRNQGDGWLNGPTVLDGVPAVASLERENVAFADLNGDGRVDLFAVDQPLQLAFSATGKGAFQPDPIVFRDRPSLRLASPDTRLMDVDGNGVTDLISTGRQHFLLFRHQSGVGWQEPQPVARLADLEQFPDVTLGDRGVRLSDMTGDGLQDFVSVQSGNVCYWPYLGNGVWGHRVEMERSPQFPIGYREHQIHLIDLDGDGCSDIVYLGCDRILIWLNQFGTRFAEPIELPIGLRGSEVRVLAADFFGDGRPGFVWASTITHEYGTGHRFLRFDQGRKPYLMTAIDNGMGGRFEMEYSTSTTMRLLDQSEGMAWTGELPFAVQLVKTIRERDTIGERLTELSLRYHDGVYDGVEREFRGFKRVSVEMAGDDSVPTSRQEYEFFQGDSEGSDSAERDRQRVLSGSLQTTRLFERVGDREELRQESRQTWETRLEYASQTRTVYFPHVSHIETWEYSATTTAHQVERTELAYDAYGNPTHRMRESWINGTLPDDLIRTEERYTFTQNVADWLVKLPVRLELRDHTGLPFAIKITYYDGDPFIGLPEGQVTQGLLTQVQELKLLDARLPADYLGGRDFTALGYVHLGTGDTQGYYATTQALRRDDRGNVVEQKDPLGQSLHITFDADGVYPIQTTDIRGKVTRFQFNPRSGEPAQTAFPDGRLVRNEYDLIGRLIATYETDDSGTEQFVKGWVLDLDTLPTAVTSIAPQTGGRNRAEFTPRTDFASLRQVSVSRVYYDGFGTAILQIATASDGLAGERRFATSRQGRTNPRGLLSAQFTPVWVPDLAYVPLPDLATAQVRQRYDWQGNLVETRGPGPVHYRVVRDATTIHHYEGTGAGELGTTVPPGPATRVEFFDARDRLIRIEDAIGDGTGVTTRYDLAVDGRIVAIYDTTNQAMAQYTLAGPAEAIRITHRDVGTRTYYRDAADRLVERVDPDGSALFYRYDRLGRLIQINYRPAGSTALQSVREIVYDADPDQSSTGRFLDGRIAIARELGNIFRYSYNRAGHLVREEVTTSGVTLVTQREYTLQGHLAAIIYPDGHRVEYSRDDSSSVRSLPSLLTETLYDIEGAIAQYQLANGVKISMPRDPTSRRLLEVAAYRDGTSLRQLRYTYDSVGNIVGLQDTLPDRAEHHTFTYDGLYRLTGFAVRQNDAMGAILRSGTYTYDALGNLQQFPETQALTLGYTDPVHPGRMTQVSHHTTTETVSYNARGHIQGFGDLQQIEFDPLDRISRIVKTDGTVIQFAYDPQSRRILKQVTQAGTTTQIRYATGLYEQHPTHAIRHVYLGTQLIASQKVTTGDPGNPVTAYYLGDHHGTVLTAMDATGTVIHQQRYSPFGSALDASDALDRYLGREKDAETGLIHFGARYYAPAIGRFISPDWFVLEHPTKPMRMPQGYNLYSYALNNPLIFKDPSGLWFGIDDLIVAAVGFVVGFVSGLIYGLANGQGWGSFLTALETGLTTAAGAWLGWNVAGPLGAIMGGMNGLVSGIHGIYDWGSAEGWFAFISDSTWGLVGTSLGNIVHILNLFGDTHYREDLSRRQNRHVYEGGVYLKKDFAFTMGNVISNAGQGGKGINTSFISNHEELHVWQSRIFGPLFQATYVVWAVGGFVVGTIVWFFNTDQDYGSVIETATYYDNPFEYWAYKNDNNNWPPSGANPVIAWG